MDLLRLIGYFIGKICWFVTYVGRENIPAKSSSSYLIAANHQTYIDPVWICLPIRRKMRFMAFDRFLDQPGVGPIISFLGAFPVSTEVGGTLKAMKAARRALKDGAVLTVFPEGARAFADGEMLPFKTGAVRIALRASVPILPVSVRGGDRIWPRGQKYPRFFRRVTITYHPLLNLKDGESHDDLDLLTEKLRETIGSKAAQRF